MSELRAISSYGPTAASARVRLDDWFGFLGIHAAHSAYAGLGNNRPASIARHAPAVARAERALRRLDVTAERVVLSREASPFSRGEVEERLLTGAAHGTYDFDDALFDDPSAIRRLLGTHDKCRRAAAAADVVIAGNDFLANWAQDHNRDVRVIPSCVDPGDYAPKTDWELTGEHPNLVWLGSRATEHYLARIAPALLEVNRRTGAVLTVISAPTRNRTLGSLNHMIRRVPWSLGRFASVLATADIAIAPLDDTPYSRGKCAYKLLQYAATRLPIIGSPVGANELALKRFDGIEATSVDDWVDGLSHLTSEPASARAERGATGRTAVVAHYSFAVWAELWCDALAIRASDRYAPDA